MNEIAFSFLTTYMLLPLLAVVFSLVAYLIAKKNRLFKNKKAILYILLIGIVLSLPGFFGFVDYWFMPYIYIILQVLYLVLGWYTIKIIRRVIPDLKEKSYIVEFLIYFIIMFIGAALFSLIFNLCNELQYGLWACTCVFTFVFPSVFKETYDRYLEIPIEIYKVWKFSHDEDLSYFESIDYNKLMVLELEVFKRVNDKTPSKVKAKAPDNMRFGIWFQKFLLDYNKKFPLTPIELVDEDGEEFGWIFYMKRSFFLPRKYVDYELTILENNIKEKYPIIVKRVKNEEYTDIESDDK